FSCCAPSYHYGRWVTIAVSENRSNKTLEPTPLAAKPLGRSRRANNARLSVEPLCRTNKLELHNMQQRCYPMLGFKGDQLVKLGLDSETASRELSAVANCV